MSIPRPKRPTYRKADEQANAGDRHGQQTAKVPKWKESVSEQPDDAFKPYAPTSTYDLNAFVSHAKFGKGIVVAVERGKVGILFEEGIKKLVQAS
jgi:hypothetical protein